MASRTRFGTDCRRYQGASKTGLLDSICHNCLCWALRHNGLEFRHEPPLQVVHEGRHLDWAYQADIFVENDVLLEIKGVEHVPPIHEAHALDIRISLCHNGAVMEQLLAGLRAAAEPTRLRLLALAARGAFCVMEFTEILGQSQPRLSRHLKLLCECGLLERVREGANVWFALPTSDHGALPRELVARLPPDDPVLEADRRQAARVLAERARVASEFFRRKGADWDEMRALDLPAQAVETALLTLVPTTKRARLLDIGTGTGRILELLAPRVREALGVDASKAMLALARSRLSGAGFEHCAVRLADMYRLPLSERSYDIVVLQMVLHHAEDPDGAIQEAVRVLAPGGHLLVVDLHEHSRTDLTGKLAHRWQGFSDASINRMFTAAGVTHVQPLTIAAPAVPGSAVPGSAKLAPLAIRIWSALRTAEAAAPASLERAY